MNLCQFVSEKLKVSRDYSGPREIQSRILLLKKTQEKLKLHEFKDKLLQFVSMFYQDIKR